MGDAPAARALHSGDFVALLRCLLGQELSDAASPYRGDPRERGAALERELPAKPAPRGLRRIVRTLVLLATKADIALFALLFGAAPIGAGMMSLAQRSPVWASALLILAGVGMTAWGCRQVVRND